MIIPRPEASETVIAGPLSNSTVASFFSRPGCPPAMSVSMAIATSGLSSNAAVRAPFNPTSSCTVPTAYTSNSVFVRFSASIIITTPARLSKALQVTRSFLSVAKCPSMVTVVPIAMPSCSTSSLLLAPTSMNISSAFIGFSRSSFFIRCGGFEPITPVTAPLSVCRTTL